MNRSEDLSHADVTTWLYDGATGLMTNKVYADGKGPTYDYTPEGRLSRRTWARGGIHLYSVCLNNLMNGVDYLGYWKAADEQQSQNLLGSKYPARKLYIKEAGDTIQSLADEVGLNADKAAAWARFAPGHSTDTTQMRQYVSLGTMAPILPGWTITVF